MNVNKVVKKKRRPPFSCIRCREKKVKCDRTKPSCHRCLKGNAACEYELPDFTTNSIRKEIDKSKPLQFVSSLKVQVPSVNNNSNKDQIQPSTGYPSTESVMSFNATPRVEYNNSPLSDVSKTNKSSIDTIHQIELLKKQIKYLEASFDQSKDCMSLVLDENGKTNLCFRSKRDARFICLGTFCNSSVWKRDCLMNNFISNFFEIKRKATKNHAFHGKKKLGKRHKISNSGIKKFYSDLTLVHPTMPVKSYDFLHKQINDKKSSEKSVNSEEFIRKIEETLPPWNVIQHHIEFYIKNIHPFIPVIDESIFQTNISNILSYSDINFSDTNKTGVKVNIGSKLDNIRICLLLLILRLSYLSTYVQVEIHMTQTKIQKEILAHPINSNIMILCDHALTEINYLRKTSVEVLQLLLLMRFYQIRACEDGDGKDGSDGVIFVGLIVTTLKTLGLHQQFDENIMLTLNKIPTVNDLSNQTNDANALIAPYLHMNLLSKGLKTFLNLWKKLLWVSFEMDLQHAMNFGCKPQFNHDPDETIAGKPTFDEFSSNVANLDIERFTINRLNKLSQISFKIFELLRILHSNKRKPTIVEIEGLIYDIENITAALYVEDKGTGCSSSGATPASDHIKLLTEVENIRCKLSIYDSLIIIQYNLLLHCENLKVKEDSGVYSETLGTSTARFSKIFPKIVNNWMWIIEETFITFEKTTGQKIDGSKSDEIDLGEFIMIVSPVVIITIDKMMTALFYIAIRLLIFTSSYDSSKTVIRTDTYNEFRKMFKHVLVILKNLVIFQGRLSKYCYGSLRSFIMYKNFIKWFENGGKYVFGFNYDKDEAVKFGDKMDTNTKSFNVHNDASSAEDYSKMSAYLNIETSRKSTEKFFFDIDLSLIKEINGKFSQIETRFNLKNLKLNALTNENLTKCDYISTLNSYLNVFSNPLPVPDPNTGTNINMGMGMGMPMNASPGVAQTSNLNTHPTPGNAESPLVTSTHSRSIVTTPMIHQDVDIHQDNLSEDSFFESFEMSDWAQVTNWFKQTTPFESFELESFSREYEGLL